MVTEVCQLLSWWKQSLKEGSSLHEKLMYFKCWNYLCFYLRNFLSVLRTFTCRIVQNSRSCHHNNLELSKTYSFSSSKVKESLPESFPREYCELNLNPSLRRSESRECRLLLVPLWLQFPEI